ncbi:MAG: hypothetical protein ABSF46_34150, partial [Terriglobia bacterium]
TLHLVLRHLSGTVHNLELVDVFDIHAEALHLLDGAHRACVHADAAAPKQPVDAALQARDDAHGTTESAQGREQVGLFQGIAPDFDGLDSNLRHPAVRRHDATQTR